MKSQQLVVTDLGKSQRNSDWRCQGPSNEKARAGQGHLPRQSLTGITWVEDDATTTITYVQTRIVAMPADNFFRDNAN